MARSGTSRPTSARRSEQSLATLLEREQQLLALDAARISAHLPAARHYAVARHDDRHRIRPECVAGGARGARRPDPPRDLAIGRDRPVRDLSGPPQNAAAEVTHQSPIDRQRELVQAALE